MSRQTGVGLPASHSPQFAPVPEPTIRTGVKAMATAVLDLLKKPAAAGKKADRVSTRSARASGYPPRGVGRVVAIS